MDLQQNHTPSAARVAVIGAGFVGSTFAYTLLLSGLASEIVLIDANQARAEGEAMDLSHAIPFSHATRLWAGDYSDCARADVVVISAGANQKPGESRLDLVKRNAGIFGQIIPQINNSGFDGVLVVATNPVDVMAYVSGKLSNLPERRVFGSGTVLDTARFRYEIGQHCRRRSAQCPRLHHRRARRQFGACVVQRQHRRHARAGLLLGSGSSA
jgi:L-lactate dehydrogenase